MSRVGSAAQTKAMKHVAGRIKLDLAQYREMAAFSKFSSDLDASTRQLLDRGHRLVEMLKQPQHHPLTQAEIVLFLFAGVRGFLDAIPVNQLADFEKEYLKDLRHFHPHIFDEVDQKHTLDSESQETLVTFLKTFVKDWLELRQRHVNA